MKLKTLGEAIAYDVGHAAGYRAGMETARVMVKKNLRARENTYLTIDDAIDEAIDLLLSEDEGGKK